MEEMLKHGNKGDFFPPLAKRDVFPINLYLVKLKLMAKFSVN